MSSATCPYLGSVGGRAIHLPRPSYQNLCYAHGMGEPIAEPHQARFCFSDQHAACPRIQGQAEDVERRAGRVGRPLYAPPSTLNVTPPFTLNVSLLKLVLVAVNAMTWGGGLLCLGVLAATSLQGPLTAQEQLTRIPMPTPRVTATAMATRTVAATVAIVATRWPVPPITAAPTAAPTSIRAVAMAPAPAPSDPAVPVHIRIPKIGLDAPVIETGWHTTEQDGQLVAEWDSAENAAGFLKNSAYPGQGGNTVLSGHHNIKGKVFARLVDLAVGDEIFLATVVREFRYIVSQRLIMQEAGVSEEQQLKNAEYIAPTADERLTLVTCWPQSTNTHRLIVIALPAGVQ